MKQRFIKYICLSILGEMAISFYILADTFFIAQGIGDKGLTALNLAIPVFNFIYGIGLMLGIGSGIRLSILKIDHKHDEINQVFDHTVLLGLVIGALFMITGVLYSPSLARMLGANDAVLQDTVIYLRTIMIFTPAFIFNNALNALVRNDNNPALATTAMIVASLMNVVLDYVFIFLCHMGMFGAVFATCLAPLIGLSILSLHFIKKKNTFHPVQLRFQFSMIQRIIKLGFPSMLIEISSGLVVLLFNTLILKITGNIGVAAYGVVCNIWLVCIAIFNGLANGMQPLTSESYGSHDTKNLIMLRRMTLTISLLISFTIYLTVFTNASMITSLFNKTNNPTLYTLAIEGFKIMFIGLFFAGVNIVLTTYFTSVESAKIASTLILLRGVVLIVPASIILSQLGMKGIWASLPLSGIMTTCVGLTYLKLKRAID